MSRWPNGFVAIGTADEHERRPWHTTMAQTCANLAAGRSWPKHGHPKGRPAASRSWSVGSGRSPICRPRVEILPGLPLLMTGRNECASTGSTRMEVKPMRRGGFFFGAVLVLAIGMAEAQAAPKGRGLGPTAGGPPAGGPPGWQSFTPPGFSSPGNRSGWSDSQPPGWGNAQGNPGWGTGTVPRGLRGR